MKEQILKIIEAVHQLYPYRVVGVRETYSHYNQGWQDACDAIEQGLSDYSPWTAPMDRLPKEGDEVLTKFIRKSYSVDGDCYYTSIDYELAYFNNGIFWKYNDEMEKLKVEVDFYMELPE
jgi:hypothetical protein